jgi:3-phenylpropionate/trans-cinnamate dioxygenase ferredoxin subunit
MREDAGAEHEGAFAMRSGFVRIASLAEIPEGELRSYEGPAGRIVLAHVEQVLFALADECPADGASLGEGALGSQEDSVICPSDGSEFDLRTGEPVDGPASDPVRVFAVRVDDGGWVEIGSPTEGGW